ncbi:hypothetical protein [Anoxynatronum sibiricum]|uniref:Response regulator n=1 Tax=Anoxynatronum sibiricum TaxID=210623 RepID=A0ABU9VRP1_9CLOT
MPTTVMVVNDSAFEKMVMGNTLEEMGYHAVLTDEFQVEKVIVQEKPAVVLVNLVMENTTGEQLILRLRQLWPQGAYVLTSCSRDKLEALKDHEALSGIMATPVTRDRLRRMMDEVIKAV